MKLCTVAGFFFNILHYIQSLIICGENGQRGQKPTLRPVLVLSPSKDAVNEYNM